MPTTHAPRVLRALLAIDAAFAVLYLAHFHSTGFADPRWDLSLEGSWGEWYGHALELTLVVGFGLLWRARRQPLYGAFLALFAFVGIDDTVQLHERVGHLAVSALGPDAPGGGFRHQDAGELACWAIAAALLTLLIRAAWQRSDERALRHGGQVLACLAVLLFCGMVMDQVDQAAGDHHRLVRVVQLAEDGGELVALSLTVAAVASFLGEVANPPTGRAAPAAPDQRWRAPARPAPR